MPPMQNGFPGGPPGQVLPWHFCPSQKTMPNALQSVKSAAETNLLVGRSRLADELLVFAGFLKASTTAGWLPRIKLLQFWQGQYCFQAMYAMQTMLATSAQAFCAPGVRHLMMWLAA